MAATKNLVKKKNKTGNGYNGEKTHNKNPKFTPQQAAPRDGLVSPPLGWALGVYKIMQDKDYTDLSELIGKRVIKRDAVIFEDDEGCSEVGVIVHAWNDKGVIDCYVAFFGEHLPSHNKKPEQIPYVLRYFLSSLEEIK